MTKVKLSTLELLNDFSVLVVEDDNVARTIIKQGLKEHFFAYYEAKDGLGGLEAFKKHRTDIIVVDIHLPKLNGFEMIKEILTLKPKQLFLIITSYDTDQNILSSVQNGALSFLRKPVDMQDLQTALLLALSKMMKQKRVNLSKTLSLDFSKETIYDNERSVFLTHTNNKIFWLLCYNLNNLVTYEMIEDYAYNGESTNKGAIHTAVLRIKKQLGNVNIENITNLGYVLKKSDS